MVYSLKLIKIAHEKPGILFGMGGGGSYLERAPFFVKYGGYIYLYFSVVVDFYTYIENYVRSSHFYGVDMLVDFEVLTDVTQHGEVFITAE